MTLAATCDMRLSQWDLSSDERAAVLRDSVPCTPALEQLVPHAEFVRTNLHIPGGWYAYNPSIASTSGGLLMVVRSSNWEYKRDQYYRINAEDGIGRSRSYLITLDADLKPATVTLLEDGADRTGEVLSRSNRGYEDLRLFEHRGRLRAVATTLDFSKTTRCQMALLDIAGNTLVNRRLLSDGTTRSEKNWSPAIWNGELFIVYRYAPMTLLRWEKDRLQPAGLDSYFGPAVALDFRGGSQLVPINGGFLTVVHTSADYPDGSRVYMHRFVRLDNEFRISGLSPQFVFREHGVEFAAGLAVQGESVVVSFGVSDLESWLVRLPLASVLAQLKTPIASVPSATDEAARRRWPSPPDQTAPPALLEPGGQQSSPLPAERIPPLIQGQAASVARASSSRTMNRPAVITTMLIPQSDGHTTRPVTDYLSHFETLVATGLPIVAYVAPSLAEQVRAPNVTVIPTTLQDLPLWRAMQGMELRLPTFRNSAKDSADYLAVINSKTELVRRTIAMMDAGANSTHAFVDFGIFHVIRDTEQAQDRLRALGATSPELVTLPGCTPDVSDHLDRVNWRFCGGFFFGPAASMRTFAELHQERARALLPTLSWEVNVWAWMERHGELACRWYQADHNDSIFDFPEVASRSDQGIRGAGQSQPTLAERQQ